MNEILLEAFRHHPWRTSNCSPPAAASRMSSSACREPPPAPTAASWRSSTTSPRPTAAMCRGGASDLTGPRTSRTPLTWTSSNGAPTTPRKLGKVHLPTARGNQAHHPGPRRLRGRTERARGPGPPPRDRPPRAALRHPHRPGHPTTRHPSLGRRTSHRPRPGTIADDRALLAPAPPAGPRSRGLQAPEHYADGRSRRSRASIRPQ
jgi:hypothetical protein